MVDDRVYADSQPLYRVTLGRRAGRTRGHGRHALVLEQQRRDERDVHQCRGGGGEDRYNIGFRLRGTTSRAEPVKSRRVNFNSDQRWHGLRAINLNALNPHSQILGSVLARKAGLPAARARAVQLRENNQQRAPASFSPFGVYAELEVLNSDFAARQFPLDDAGNLYQAIGGGNLDYLGPTPSLTATPMPTRSAPTARRTTGPTSSA